MLIISTGQSELFFMDLPGRTGKTYFISLNFTKIQSNNDIALIVPLSGIAATLMNGGRTAHSEFKLPLNIQNNLDTVYNIKKTIVLGHSSEKIQNYHLG
jgi:hypothetical protein